MGWQLFPTGVGWREFSRTRSTGTFRCPNDRCKGHRQEEQQYRHREARNWATVLFLPVIPLNRRGHYIECRHCKSTMPVSVLDRSGAVASATTVVAPDDRPPDMGVPTGPAPPGPRALASPPESLELHTTDVVPADQRQVVEVAAWVAAAWAAVVVLRSVSSSGWYDLPSVASEQGPATAFTGLWQPTLFGNYLSWLDTVLWWPLDRPFITVLPTVGILAAAVITAVGARSPAPGPSTSARRVAGWLLIVHAVAVFVMYFTPQDLGSLVGTQLAALVPAAVGLVLLSGGNPFGGGRGGPGPTAVGGGEFSPRSSVARPDQTP